MKPVPQSADLQVWVCVNDRDSLSELPCCTSALGNEIYQALSQIAARMCARLGVQVWVNRTLCQGFCSSEGVTVSFEPGKLKWQGVKTSDLPELTARMHETLRSLTSTQK